MRNLCLCLLLVAAGQVWAQFSSNIQGVVQDASHAPIPKAVVKLRSIDTDVQLSTFANEAGVYRFSSLAPGRYEITAEAPGFQPQTLEATLLTAQTAGINIPLNVAGVTERVEVAAVAPPLDTSDSRVHTTIQNETLQDLPLQGRNFLGLAALAPGVTGYGAVGGGAPADAPDNFSTEKTVDVSGNGRNSSGNNFTVDGLNVTSNIIQGVANLSPNPDSIQEIAVQTNSFTAESGRASSLQVAVTTKSGTNEFHGTGSYFFTNQSLWARTVFTPKYEPFKKHDLTATLGGPVVKNRTFFFASVEPLRSQVSGADSVRTFESQEFVEWARARFPNTIGMKVLNDHPIINTAVTGVNRRAQDVFGAECGTPATLNIPCNMPMVMEGRFKPSPFRNGLQYSFRGDQYLRDAKDRIYANYYYTSVDIETIPMRRGFYQVDDNLSRALQVNWTHTFSPALLNEASFGFIRVLGNRGFEKTLPFRVPNINIAFQNTNISPGFAASTFIQNNFNWRDVVSWVKGSHTLKFGGEVFWGDDDARFNAGFGRPTFLFNNLLELVEDRPFQQDGPVYDPLTGQPGLGGYRHLLNTYGLFVQDEWKFKSNLTFTLGLRYDDYGNITRDKSKTATFANVILGSGSSLPDRFAGASVRSVEGVYSGRLKNNWSPRFGFAWDPSRQGRWSIRGGIGLYHDWIPLGEANRIRGNPPGNITPQFRRGGAIEPIFSLGTSDVFPFGFRLPQIPAGRLDERGGLVGTLANVGGIDRDILPSSTLIYNIGVERQLPGRIVAGAAYSGSQTWDGVIGTDFNRFAGDLLDGRLDRLNPSFGQMYYEFNGNRIRYHAMILSARRNIGARSSIQTSYTLSRVTDLGQAGSRVNRDGGFQIPDQRNLEANKGFSDWDVTHAFSLGGFYNLPAPSARSLVKAIFGGWQLTSVTLVQGGRPFQPVNRSPFLPVVDASGRVTGYRPGSGDYNADGFNYDYPNTPSKDFTGSHSRQEYINGLFAAADFPAPAPGTQGNLKRHIYRGPGFINVDTGMIKNNPMRFLGERGNLQLRFEFFNVLNRVNLRNVDGSITSSTFGRSTSTFTPRVIQLGARLLF